MGESMRIVGSLVGLAGAVLASLAFASSGAAQTESPAQAVAAVDPAVVYGSLPAYEFVEVSPDGSRLAYVTVTGESRSLLVIDPQNGTLLGGSRVGEAKVRSLEWVGNDHILVTMSSTEGVPELGIEKNELAYGELYDIPARQLRRVLGGTAKVKPIIMGQTYIRQIGGRPTLFAETARFERAGLDGYSIFQIDLGTGRGRSVHEWDRRRPDYIAGADGNPIAAAHYYSDTGRWVLQLRRGAFWEEAWVTVAPLDQPYLDGLGTTPGSIVIHAAREGEKARFHQIDVATNVWSELPFEGDPDALVRHPETGLVIGAAYTKDDERDIRLNDPAAATAWRSVQSAFRGRHPTISSWNQNLRRVVVRTWGENDSGRYHLLNLDDRRADEIGALYPKAINVGEVRPVVYPAADGMQIPGYLTLPPGLSDPKGIPLVVLPHGGPAARDTLSFDWWAQALASQGYAVLQPNFRGSDGLGQAHLEAGYAEWGGKMQSDLSDGVRYLAAQGIIDPDKVCIVGASYGGYAALAGPTLDHGTYRCAVSVAGVSDLRRMVAWSAQRSGARNSPVVRYWNRCMGADRVGDRTLDARSPRQQAGEADAPILLLHGIDDTVVPYEQSRFMAEALERAGKPYELIRMDGEDHWLSRGASRQQMLRETIRFLKLHNPVT
jgi:dipeptidyl aminopeptidase/acylaminoacyl peptidase